VVCPEVAGELPIQGGSLYRLDLCAMTVIADPTAPAAAAVAPAADLFTDLLIDPRSPGPIRAELFGPERLDEHARRLAAVCTLAPAGRANSPLLRRFADNGRFLMRAQERIVDGGEGRDDRGLDAEWLLDNFHIVEEVLREVRQDLPSGYDEELPKLAVEPAQGYPRVHALALAMVAHNDSELDEARIGRYVQAFQEVAPLTIGELWALPTMLRLVVLENLRGLAEQMLWGWDERIRAERWASDLLAQAHDQGLATRHAAAATDGDQQRPAIAPPPFPDPSDPAVVRLLQLLRDKGLTAAAVLGQLETQLEERGTDANDVLRREHRRQAVNQVSVANCVISLRVLSAIDWNEFFERHSLVEKALRTDPAGVYAQMDFATRDRYRRTIETIARGADVDEQVVVGRIVELARAGRSAGVARGHVGYYLLDRGLDRLKAELRPKLEWPTRAVAWARAHPRLSYFGLMLAVFFPLLAALAGAGAAAGASAGTLALLVLVLLVPMSELAVGLINQLVTMVMPPRMLPKLEFKEGIPADCATVIVMPTMLVRPGSAAMLLERLEIHYLANPDPQFRFALLTDFADAPQEERPEDESYVAAALEGVKALNARYCPGGPDRFFVFHRRRMWNPVQGCWMGWERKRGKLSEFNRLIRGDRGTSYAWQSADPAELRAVRFVITLDADTQLPRDSARRLVGTLAHPLNAPRFDPALGRVIEGYGVLQPRVSFHLVAATHSRFAALLAASGGIDPYSTAASDCYMDLFGLGSFTGKGIYDIEAFEAATGRTFPENQILSHDLIEGNYARCGLASDTELFDDFPARYHAYARREHRWVRGDWQLLPWLGRRVPSSDARRANPLPLLERWKLFDNLRRSLVAPALVVLLVLGWTVFPGSPWLWTAVALAVPALPLLQVIGTTLFAAARKGSLAGLKRWRDTLPATAGQVLLSIAFLANQARLAVDATARTLLRHFVTRRHMLEWETAASTERRLGGGVLDFVANMWPSMALAVILALVVAGVHPGALPAAAGVLAAWFFAPLVAYWVSLRPPAGETPLSESERQELSQIARRTWHFFETFVGHEDHWLPPDNFQEDPAGKVAHRTSPTNMGLLLLATLAAHDFGTIGLRTLLRRLAKSFDTFDRLEKHWGHFLNWYDTRTLQSLHPAYVSTVDSGNMLGCLITLRQGLREKIELPLFGPEAWLGLDAPLGLVAQALQQRPPATGLDAAQAAHASKALEEELGRVRELIRTVPADLLGRDDALAQLDRAALGLLGRIRSLAATGGEPRERTPMETWARAFVAEVQEHRAELAALAPWLEAIRELDLGGGPGRPALINWADEASARRWRTVRDMLVAQVSLTTMADRSPSIQRELAALAARVSPEAAERLQAIAQAVRDSTAAELLAEARQLGVRTEAHTAVMDFRPLYKPDRHLYAIGCNLVQGRLDNACYDLVASEAALTSFLTIARGEAPRRHWFQLGRPYTRTAGRIGLISWGGTMFEYLMPRLMMKSLEGTLVSEACRSAVARQVEYGRQAGVPWGISESAFGARNLEGDYDYQAFGVPGLGLKRGLERDLVIAPYATALASMIRPREALENFRRLAAEGGEGTYGFYDAIDYTPDRIPKGKRSIIVKNYMAHHQGMSLVALANALLAEPMVRRFSAEPMVRAVAVLLQERIPRDAPLIEPSEIVVPANREPRSKEAMMGGSPLLSRRLTTPHTPLPRTHILSNERYHVMLTNAGSGWSTCRDLAVTRWREDATRDCWGQFCYVRDLAGGFVWSAGYQPIGSVADEFEAVFAADKVSFRRRDGAVESLWEIAVSTEQLAEVRRLTLFNHDDGPRDLEVTSYAEVVLGRHADDVAHPAFGKLFLETEWLPGSEALLCRRRPRSPGAKPIWAVHVMAVEGTALGTVEYETDRARFLGRGRTPADPAALEPGAVLSRTVGPVLDPVFSLRRRVRLEAGESAVVAFTTAVADSRDEALTIADQYHQGSAVARTFELAWAHSLIEHRHRSWSPEEVHLFQRLASRIIFAGSALRAAPAAIAANRQGAEGLWRHGISGDRPIVLARIAGGSELALARQLLAAHTFLRLKGLDFDLVLLSEEAASYQEALPQTLKELIRSSDAHDLVDRPGGVFVLKQSHLSEEDLLLLQAAARVVLVGDRGLLDIQLDRIERPLSLPGALAPSREPSPWLDSDPGPSAGPVAFDNGLGGFAAEGRQYCLTVRGRVTRDARRNGKPRFRTGLHAALPPAPWSNIIANRRFGFLITEGGSGYTWSGNSQSNRLTPWSNDPVSDPPGEVVYLRDEETGEFWSPTPLPVPSAATTIVRHGQGFTSFERRLHGFWHELVLFVPPEDPVKILLLKVRNLADRARRLSITFYVEWVLGSQRDSAALQVVTELDPETGALLARNAYRSDFASSVSFADMGLRPASITADRTEFLGRHGSTAAPAALRRVGLSGRLGAALDPCAALHAPLALGGGEEREIVLLLGEADGLDAARELLRRYRALDQARAALEASQARWDQVLSAVQVQTPDPAFDLIMNRWLPYQVLSCRLWGRSAFYQSGGAYGFRDQLQDVMALVYGAPDETRAQILRAAARQFTAGDVQHWWHPPTGRGVRTRISDDFLWLPLVVEHYVRTTGDAAILDEPVGFLEGPTLAENQEDDYGLPAMSSETAPLYDHCIRALEHGMRLGPHGLPLMGTGDWNDGMNKVGAGGRGESVWLAWFLLTILRRFIPQVEARGDTARAESYRSFAEALRGAVEASGWDGHWYRRAYFDDGTPLGSATDEECQIDLLAQTWAVISGAAEKERAHSALTVAEERLVLRAERLILLLAPPFDRSALEPGYIKGYVPGIRENGGQYTHAAAWLVQAVALAGRGGDAYSLFDLLNPIRHTDCAAAVARYKVEPYVLAGDVYGRPPHTGRGGWTWYTGSAGWLYRVGLETLLGFSLDGDRLVLDPRIPRSWTELGLTYRYRSATYRIAIRNPDGVEYGLRSLTVDGQHLEGASVPLCDDGQTHEVIAVLGER
jgi:cyclic beta-1,2-glucan synthetase